MCATPVIGIDGAKGTGWRGAVVVMMMMMRMASRERSVNEKTLRDYA